MSRMSAPAASALTAAASSPQCRSIARIRRSSVTTGPPKPSSSRRSPVMVARESVAGNSGSSARLKTCAVMMPSASRSAISIRYGVSSGQRSAVSVTSTKPLCESPWLEPCPGKCLRAVSTPSACNPRITARAWAVTSRGSALKLRPAPTITGFLGLQPTSTTGARFQLIPALFSTRAIRRASSSVSVKSLLSPSSSAENVAVKPASGPRRMTWPHSASTETRSRRPVHSRERAAMARVRRPACASLRILRAKSTTPPTPVSQRSRSSAALSSASVPSKPTSRSWPSSASSAARRTGSSGGYVRQPAAARTRRLAATSRGNEPLHPPPIDGIPYVAALLDRGADDRPVRDGEELGDRLGGDPAADEDRHLRNGAPDALDVGERRRPARGGARHDEHVGEPAVGEVARGLLELDGDERDRVLAPDVREDAGLRAEQPPVAERVVGVGLDDPLVGDDGARVDVDADEPAADGGDDGQRRARVVLEHVDAERGLGE